MSRKKIALFAGVISTIAIIALVIGLVNKPSPSPSMGGQASNILLRGEELDRVLADRPPPPPAYVPWDEAQVHQALSRVIDEKRDQLDLSQLEADQLKRAAGAVVSAYWTSDMERYLQLLEAQGLVPDENFRGSQGQRMMRSMTRSIRGAPIDSNRIEITLISKGGTIVDKRYLGLYTKSIVTPRGEKDIISPAESQADVIAISIPAWLLSTGVMDTAVRPFEGTLVLFFAQRPNDGEWLLFKVGSQTTAMVSDGTHPLHPIMPPL